MSDPTELARRAACVFLRRIARYKKPDARWEGLFESDPAGYAIARAFEPHFRRLQEFDEVDWVVSKMNGWKTCAEMRDNWYLKWTTENNLE